MRRLTIAAGLACNNNCLFCYQRNNADFNNFLMSSKKIKEVIHSNRNMYTEISFSNNEPTLRKDILELIGFAKKEGFKKIVLQTNARMFYYKSFCKKVIDAGATNFVVAVHGPNASIHDSLTQCKGSFKQTITGIKNLVSMSQEVGTITTINKINYRYLKEIYLMLKKCGSTSQVYIFISHSGNAGKNFDKIVPRMSQTSPYIKEMINSHKEEKTNWMLQIKGIPFCMVGCYEEYVKEFYDETMVLDGMVIEDIFNFRSQRGKTKFVKCKKCKRYNVCEGVWKGYAAKFGEEEFNPIK